MLEFSSKLTFAYGFGSRFYVLGFSLGLMFVCGFRSRFFSIVMKDRKYGCVCVYVSVYVFKLNHKNIKEIKIKSLKD